VSTSAVSLLVQIHERKGYPRSQYIAVISGKDKVSRRIVLLDLRHPMNSFH